MKREHGELYAAAECCRAIASLTGNVERDPAELGAVMLAVGELARSAHDKIDFALRRLAHDPGCGYTDAIRRELDEALDLARRGAK